MIRPALAGVRGPRPGTQHVADGDRLDARVDPPRADHHGHALGEVADHLEREAAGADDHGGAELRDGHAGLAQRVAGLLPRAQVGREVGGRVAEAAEVDDALARRRRPRRGRTPSRRRGRVRRSPRPWPCSAPGSRRRRRRPARRRASPGAGRRRHDLDLAGPVAPLQSCGSRTRQRTRCAGLEQARHEPAADVAGGAGDEDERAVRDCSKAVKVPPSPEGRTSDEVSGSVRGTRAPSAEAHADEVADEEGDGGDGDHDEERNQEPHGWMRFLLLPFTSPEFASVYRRSA